jgi:hypothetical protein
MGLPRLRRLDFRTDVLPFVVATAGEFVALYLWLEYADQGRLVLANVILWLGFAVERTAVYLWILYIYRKAGAIREERSLPLTIVGLFAITLSEILIWFLWLSVADGDIAWLASTLVVDFALAGVLLMSLMLVQHSIEMAALRRTPPFAYLRSPNTIFFTFMEVAGAVGWLYFVRTDRPLAGGLCLLVGLSIEHVLQGTELRPE